VIRQIFSFTEENMRRGDYTALNLVLFGGEPLLNSPAVFRLLEAAQEHGLTEAFLITNGTLLTLPRAEKLYANGLGRIQITLDGNRRQHDRLRVTRAGRPTFDLILRNVSQVAKHIPFTWTLRVNVGSIAGFDAEELLDLLACHLPVKRVVVDFELVNDTGVGHSVDSPAWEKAVDRFVSWYCAALQRGFLLRLPASATTCAFCSTRAGREGAVVNADGRLYSCWESCGKEGFAVGDVWSGYCDEATLEDRWVSCGYSIKPRWTSVPERSFRDFVDAARLDWLVSSGILTPR